MQFGVVVFESADDAETASNHLNGLELVGHKLRVCKDEPGTSAPDAMAKAAPLIPQDAVPPPPPERQVALTAVLGRTVVSNAAEHENYRPRVLVAASGSVAAVKVPELCCKLNEFAEVQLVYTAAAVHFIGVSEGYNQVAFDEWRALALREHHDKDEWVYGAVGDPVLHIELRKWADILVVCPASANTLAKLAIGLSDNLLTCVARAWDYRKPLLVCPAMNTAMWDHPITARHLQSVAEFGGQIVMPVSKTLACGDSGQGALATVDEIVARVQSLLCSAT